MGRRVNYCGVYGCKNTSINNPTLIFFTLTKEKLSRNPIWIELIGREDVIDYPKTVKVCSIHFTPDVLRNRRLKNNALPSLYLPSRYDTFSSVFDPPNTDIYSPRSSFPVQLGHNGYMQTGSSIKVESMYLKQKFYTVGTQTDTDFEPNESNDKPPVLVTNIATQTDFNTSFLREALENSNNFSSKPGSKCCSNCGHPVTEVKKPITFNINIETSNESTVKKSQKQKVVQSNGSNIKPKKNNKDLCGSVTSVKRKSEHIINNNELNYTDINNSKKRTRKFKRPVILFESDLSEDDEEQFEVVVPYRLASDMFDTTKGPQGKSFKITTEEPSTSKINK